MIRSETPARAEAAAETIHGCSPAEQRRLYRQAEVLAPVVFADLPLVQEGELLEIGCGVGAELALIDKRAPTLGLTGVDRSRAQIRMARSALADRPGGAPVRLLSADAAALPFPAARFDQVISIWLLEHVTDAERALREALRVLKPGGLLCCTEVDNRSLGFTPEVPVIRHWWERLNARQRALGGDPCIGGKLADLARAAGAERIRTRNLAVISSRGRPERRRLELTYLRHLLLSAAPALRAAGEVSDADVHALRASFAEVRQDAQVDFRYFAVQLCCHAPSLSSQARGPSVQKPPPLLRRTP